MATFVITWLEPTARKLIEENIDKNYIDKLIYSQTIKIEEYCVSIIANLLNPNENDSPVGTSTIGSTEAALLAAMNYKFIWKKFHNKNAAKPQIIFGSNVQVCWLKFAKYFEVEPIIIPVDSSYRINLKEVGKKLSNRTICVVGILGDTYTGQFQDIETLNTVVDKYNSTHNWKIPIHIDAAIGGFIAPFHEKFKNYLWDFRLNWVKSINISAHKYGHVAAGLGWAIWRNIDDIDKDLIFDIDYLGGVQKDFSLNFSKNSLNVVEQYYNLVRLGKEGYSNIIKYLYEIQEYLISKFSLLTINNIKIFNIIYNEYSTPIVVLKLTEEAENLGLDLKEISLSMEKSGWSIPVYSLSDPYEDITIAILVLRLGFDKSMSEKLFTDMKNSINDLINNTSSSKHHYNAKIGPC